MKCNIITIKCFLLSLTVNLFVGLFCHFSWLPGNIISKVCCADVSDHNRDMFLMVEEPT